MEKEIISLAYRYQLHLHFFDLFFTISKNLFQSKNYILKIISEINAIFFPYFFKGYPGGLREMPALVMRERFPERILEKAVWGMLPKNKLRHSRFEKLRVFAEEHNLAPDIVKKIAPLPPHFTQREYVAEKLDADDPMAHLRGFYVVRVRDNCTIITFYHY